jgi:Tachylectin
VWAMELMHVLTDFDDLYPFSGNMGAFDEMACNCGTHPSAYTKAAISWLDQSAIVQHTVRAATYSLHSVSLIQPPPSGRSAAIRIGSQVPYLMVESRQMADQFDANIPSQGVIVYRVQTSDPLGGSQNNLIPVFLLTTTALTVGQAFTSDTNVSVSVTGTIPGGFTVVVDDRNAPFETGELLFYRDLTRNGTGDVNTPAVIGQGGWQEMKFLFAGDPGAIYAVNQQGQLLFYRDWTRNGTGDVNTPGVIGQGGWQQMRQLFYGGDGIIYAVNQQGQLLFYRDGTGDVNTPSVIGQGGWQQMQFLFSGGDGIIYAVVA